MMSLSLRFTSIPALLIIGFVSSEAPAQETKLPLVYADDFEDGIDQWQALDPEGWKAKETEQGTVLSQFKKASDYEPPHRSPRHIALLEDVVVGDFVLEVDARSTHPDYGHRDLCLFFGYQDPAHFYYVHLGKKTDDHANQIFIVNDAPRTKISTKTTPGTDWDEQWHRIRIVRRVDEGTIQVFFDRMDQPVMEAQDKSFSWGQIGLGSFDDTGDWDNFKLYGEQVEKGRDAASDAD